MEILKEINEKLEAFKAEKAELTKKLQTEFPKLFTGLFEKSKRINSFGWKQYTPYFNDGDECIFGVHADYLTINGIDDYSDDEEMKQRKFLDETNYVKDGNSYKSVPNPDFDKKEYKIYEQITKVLNSIPEEFFKDLFGDHVSVTVNRDGTIETEEYEHD